MIPIGTDEAEAYDKLSILYVKRDKQPHNHKILAAFNRLHHELIAWIGPDLHYSILKSDEYASLLKANQTTFDWIDEVKQTDGSARETQRRNDARIAAKTILQQRFFPTPITEVKL